MSTAPGIGPLQPLPDPSDWPSRLVLFQARLTGRDSFPAERLVHFAGLPLAELRAAAVNTRHVAARIRADLRLGLARGQSLSALLARLDLALVSCDHDWRDIFVGLVRQGSVHDALGRVAVEAYLRYLDSRHQQLCALAEARAAPHAGRLRACPVPAAAPEGPRRDAPCSRPLAGGGGPDVKAIERGGAGRGVATGEPGSVC